MRCVVCEHQHPSAKPETIVKANGKEFRIVLCAECALFFAGQRPDGCHTAPTITFDTYYA